MSHSLHRPLGACVLLATACLGSPDSVRAQVLPVTGIVLDDRGHPVKSAEVLATNEVAVPRRMVTRTDDRGRFSMLGLRRGTWAFTVSAPGHLPAEIHVPVQDIGENAALRVVLARDRGRPNLSGNDLLRLQADLAAAAGLVDAGRHDEAITLYRAVLARAPRLTSIHLQLGHAYRLKGSTEEALAEYAALLQAEPGSEAARVAAAYTHLERKDAPAAEQILRVVSAEARSSELFCALGEAVQAQGRSGEAESWYNKASGMSPQWGRPLLKLGQLALALGDTARAAVCFDKAIAADASAPEAAEARAALERIRQ